MYFIYGIIIAVSLLVDQMTKYAASVCLKNRPSIHLIGDFLKFTYVENKGAAFGILQNQRTIFIIVTIILILGIIYAIFFYKKITKYTKFSLVLILCGALGNFIDRIRLRYVIDFIDVTFGSLYNFPVFNVADCFVVVGTLMIVLLIILNKFEKSDIDEYD